MASFRPSSRAWAAVLVLLAWVGSLGWLGVRQLNRTESAALRSEAALRLAPGAAWFGLYAGDLLVGQAGITLDTLSPGYQILETFAVELPGDSVVNRSSRLTVTTVTASLAVTKVVSRGVGPNWRDSWVATLGSGRLQLAPESRPTETAGAELPTVPTTSAFLPFRLALSGGLVEGRQRTSPGLTGWPPAVVQFEIAAGRDTVAIFADSSEVDARSETRRVAHLDTVPARAVTVHADGPGERWWVDHRGNVVGIESAFGLHWVRTDFDLVAAGLRDRSAARVATLRTAFPAVRALTRADTSRRAQRFVLSRRDGRPIDQPLLQSLGTGRQSIRGDTLLILPAGAAPASEAARRPMPIDPLADPTDSAIVAFASRTMTGAQDSVGALLRELRRRVTLDTSSVGAVDAQTVLRTGRGRAGGIARLFVATATAAGIPARLAVGILPVGDGFATHAWAEIRVRGFWSAVDPAFGRAAAGTHLIRLFHSGSADANQLLPRIAQLRVIALPSAQESP